MCYEDNEGWHGHLQPLLGSCDFRLTPLIEIELDDQRPRWYERVTDDPFDLLLIDGPIGTARFSRFGAVDYIRRTVRKDFVIVLDDAERKGENDTLERISGWLRAANIDFKLGHLVGRTTQAVLVGGRFWRVASYF